MRIVERITVPTGDILVVEGHYGKLELLSIGDYGKEVNLKCDAMGLSRKPDPVRHTALLPLEKKWVITVSTQYGCSVGCSFCDVPQVGPGKNATFGDLVGQVITGVALHPEVSSTGRLNVHFARMGEPTFNFEVINAAHYLAGIMNEREWGFHPVVSTMMPSTWQLDSFLRRWISFKNEVCAGNAGLQLSINSTDAKERREMFGSFCMDIENVASIMAGLPEPLGRKYTLNFAVAGYKVDAYRLADLFHPDDYVCKLTPMHKTATAEARGIRTAGDYTTYEPYEELEERLKAAGFEVLVFIASREEDEGRITCGNAILSGTRPFDL